MMQYGPRFYNEPYTHTGIRTVRITDLDNSGSLAFDRMPRIEPTEKAREAFCLEPGDLIFARSGATVGKVALIPEGAPPCIAGAYFLRIRFSPSIVPEYARMLLMSDSIQHIIAAQSRQSAQQNFSGPAVRRLPMPVPPFALQKSFRTLERSLGRLAPLRRAHADECVSLRATLTSCGFNGEL